jgi:hypothetical protein
VSARLVCAACGAGWQAPFSVQGFLCQALGEWAGLLLDDVHELAAGYGWSEPEILALGPERRRGYLQRLRS